MKMEDVVFGGVEYFVGAAMKNPEAFKYVALTIVGTVTSMVAIHWAICKSDASKEEINDALDMAGSGITRNII